MSRPNNQTWLYGIAALIGAALLYVRIIAVEFRLGTNTFQHPYTGFVGALIVAGAVWLGLIWLIPKFDLDRAKTKKLLLHIIGIGLAFRILFIGSTPIYENDWNRYLWDGAVVTQGINPYQYAPTEVVNADQNSPSEILNLQQLSDTHDQAAARINYGELTTIYPPVAQAVFAFAAQIKPFDLDVLRAIYILIDGLTFFLLVKALSLCGRSPLWAALYALNPLLIYANFNAAHMDVLLPPVLLLAFILVKRRPIWATTALAVAGAVKIWPLLLAPSLFRSWRSDHKIYIASAIVTALIFLILMSPLLIALSDNSGLVAYSGGWIRNSFLFPMLESIIAIFSRDPGTTARLCVVIVLTGLSLYLGFKRTPPAHNLMDQTENMAGSLLLIALALFLLSPTGYPWYFIWVLIFLSFKPSYGVALLGVTLPLYYLRYALDERGLTHLYENVLVPLQFGLPITMMIVERFAKRRLYV